MGTVRYYQGRYEDAVKMHNYAIELAPSDHRAWGKLAAAQRYLPGQDMESQATYQKAIELVTDRLAINPEDAEDLSYLSTYLVNTEKLSAARDAINSALLLAPESPNTHYFAALLEIRSGNRKQAVGEVKKAIWNGYSRRLLGADPQFEELRKDADFKALISESAEIRASR
jgi:cytochrome c-type biogenesis protein CcmH/NrfG